MEEIRWDELPELAELEIDVPASSDYIVHTTAMQSAQVESSYDSVLWEIVTIDGSGGGIFTPFSNGQSIELPNSGYFYIEDEDGITTLPGDQFKAVGSTHAFHHIDPIPSPSDIAPGTEPYTMVNMHSRSSGLTMMMRKTPLTEATGGTSFSLMHYSPYAYSALNIYRVMAAIMIEKGLDLSFVDQDAFERADTAWQIQFDWVTGYFGYPITYIRTVDELISQTFKDILLHTWDLLFVDYNGSLSVGSGTNPYSVSVDLGSVVGAITSESDHSLICNSVDFRWDSPVYMKSSKSIAAPTMPDKDDHLKEMNNTDEGEYGYNYTAYPDPDGTQLLDNSTSSSAFSWGVETSGLLLNLGSVAKYGKRDMHHTDAYEIKGQTEVRQIKPMRLKLARHKDFASEYAQRTVYENRPKQRVSFTQDMIGMDFDIGYAGDFDVGAGELENMRCIERTTDFNNLTVESVWLESFIPTE